MKSLHGMRNVICQYLSEALVMALSQLVHVLQGGNLFDIWLTLTHKTAVTVYYRGEKSERK